MKDREDEEVVESTIEGPQNVPPCTSPYSPVLKVTRRRSWDIGMGGLDEIGKEYRTISDFPDLETYSNKRERYVYIHTYPYPYPIPIPDIVKIKHTSWTGICKLKSIGWLQIEKRSIWAKIYTPNEGLEPSTTSLKGWRSTDWASPVSEYTTPAKPQT